MMTIGGFIVLHSMIFRAHTIHTTRYQRIPSIPPPPPSSPLDPIEPVESYRESGFFHFSWLPTAECPPKPVFN